MQVELDVIVYGATGYTGRLVVEHLVKNYTGPGAGRWGIAGRSLRKLEALRDELDVPAAVPLIVADVGDPMSLRVMCARTQVVASTVGPYQQYGTAVVEACVDTGTGYTDLSGEPAWMRDMIDRFERSARQSGARIVFSTGFDSAPFDIGVFLVQQEALSRFNRTASHVHTRIRSLVGGLSGGSLASYKATLQAIEDDPRVAALLADPFALTPGFAGPPQPAGNDVAFDELVGAWVAPFVLAPMNRQNVHRSNLLLGHRYGREFVYDEMVIGGAGEEGRKRAEAGAKQVSDIKALAGAATVKPGEGPSKAERDRGHYDFLVVGEVPGAGTIEVVVTGDADFGYGSTSKILAESALCLALDVSGEGGFWTPASMMALKLRDRLVGKAGLTFSVN